MAFGGFVVVQAYSRAGGDPLLMCVLFGLGAGAGTWLVVAAVIGLA